MKRATGVRSVREILFTEYTYIQRVCMNIRPLKQVKSEQSEVAVL